MLGKDVGSIRRCYPLGGTLSSTFVACGATGGTIVFKGFGACIKSGGGDGISILGTNLVNGFAQPARSAKQIKIECFISHLPSFSKA